jgi:hypothetical protein
MSGIPRASRWPSSFATALALLFACTVPASSTPLPQSDELAEQLVGNWIDALGGMEAYWPLESARFTITTEIYDTETGRLRRTRPRYVAIARTERGEVSRIERWEDDDFIQQAWNGEEVWAAMNGAALAPGDKDYDEVQYVSGDVQYWISLPFKLRDDGVNLHHRGVDDDGRHVVGVSFGEGVGLHDGDTWQYWFEDGKTWPVQVAYMEEGKTNWNYLRFEDIRTVDGYTFVGRRVHYNEAGQLTKVLHTHDFELNPTLNPALFSRPR